MALALTPVSVLWVAFALAAVGLTFLVLRAKPYTKGRLVLVALLVQQAWQAMASVVLWTATDPALRQAAVAWAIPSWFLWAPLVFLAGPLLLGDSRGARPFALLGGLGAAPGLLLLATWPLTPDFILAPGGAGLTDLAASILFLSYAGFAFTVAVLAREALRTPLPVRRAQLALLAAVFSVEGAFHASQDVAKLAFGLDFHGQAAAPLGPAALSVGALLAFAAIAAWALRVGLRDSDPERRRWGRILAGFLGASALTGLAASPVTVANEFTDPAGAFHALWDLASLALIVYAALRFQLFSLERRAKQSVAVTAAIVMGFVAFNAAQEVAEGLVADVEVLQGLPASGILAAVLVGAVCVPIGKGAQAVAKRVFPHVDWGVDYERQRRLKIYAAALEGAFADGITTPKEAASLRRLRAELGIGEDDHDRLEVDARARLTAAAAPAAA